MTATVVAPAARARVRRARRPRPVAGGSGARQPAGPASQPPSACSASRPTASSAARRGAGARVSGRARVRGRRHHRPGHARRAGRRSRRLRAGAAPAPLDHDRGPARARHRRRRHLRPETRPRSAASRRARGFEVDGIVGPQTLGALGVSGAAAPVSGAGEVPPSRRRAQAGLPVRARRSRPALVGLLRARRGGRSRRPASRSRAPATSRRAPACTSTARDPARRPRVLRRQRPGRVARRHRHERHDGDLGHHRTASASTPPPALLGQALYGARRVG